MFPMRRDAMDKDTRKKRSLNCLSKQNPSYEIYFILIAT